MALVARALAGMPAQTGGATPLGAAYIHTRHDWHRAPAEHHLGELLAYLERNQGALVHYAARRRNGEPISTAFMESAVNEIIAKRMNKRQTSCSFPARENLRKGSKARALPWTRQGQSPWNQEQAAGDQGGGGLPKARHIGADVLRLEGDVGRDGHQSAWPIAFYIALRHKWSCGARTQVRFNRSASSD